LANQLPKVGQSIPKILTNFPEDWESIFKPASGFGSWIPKISKKKKKKSYKFADIRESSLMTLMMIRA
jgi:hypothetical protein